MRKIGLLLLTLFSVCILPLWSQINTDRVLSIGRNALYFEDYVLSIQYFNQVIKAKPYLAEPYLYRAIAKFSLDDFKGTENDITLCLERNPFLVYAYQCRGSARQNLGDFKGAIEDYSKGLEFNPEDKQMLINKGIAHIQEKQYDDAEQTLNLLLKYQPKFMQTYLTRGAMFAEKGDTLKAISDYNVALELDKYYAPTYGRRGLLYFQQENLKAALTDFNEAIRLDPSFVGYYINRGLVSFRLNDLRGAMSDFDAVIKLDPTNQITLFNRGLLRAQVGDASRAIEDFDLVIRQEPDNFMAIYNRALLHDEIGKYKEAIQDLDLVIDEYPHFVPGFYYRAEVKRKIHDIKGADTDYWYAYGLEQKLKKEKGKGKKITGKGILDATEEEEETASDDQTREKSDKDIEKFNRLVTYDKDEQQESQHQNELRGKVQDKQVKVDLMPQFIITYYEKIETLKNTSFFDKSITDYNQKMVLNRQLKITNDEAALTDEQADSHFKSINDYSLSIDRDSSDINALFGRAMDYMVLQDLSESLADLNRILALNPNFIMAYFNRAVIRLKQMELENYSTEKNDTFNLSLNIPTGGKKTKGQYEAIPIQDNSTTKGSKRMFDLEQVARDYDRIIAINPNFVCAYYNRANLRCSQKDFNTAIFDYNEAINRDVDFAEAYFNRGLARLYMGDTKRGVADLSKAGELGIVNAYSIIKRMVGE